jgi:hypothetical protein
MVNCFVVVLSLSISPVFSRFSKTEVADAIILHLQKNNSEFSSIGRIRTDGILSDEGFQYDFKASGTAFRGIELVEIVSVSSIEEDIHVVIRIPKMAFESRYRSIGGLSGPLEGEFSAVAKTPVDIKLTVSVEEEKISVKRHDVITNVSNIFTIGMKHPLFVIITPDLMSQFLMVLSEKQANQEYTRNLARRIHEVVDGISV